MARALVLNASYEPLTAVSLHRALSLVFKEKVDVVATNGLVVHSEKMTIHAPAVIRLKYYVNVPYRGNPVITKKAVFARDGWECQYCGKDAENIDHVIPKSRGGTHTWDNVVASCRKCNSKKDDHLPHEIGFNQVKPTMPANPGHLMLGKVEPEWEPFIR